MVLPIDQNGDITMYQVLYHTLQEFSGAENVTVLERMAFLRGLEEHEKYNISVRAYTSVGAGPYSDEYEEKTLEDGM